jgi:hypothetical protein
MGPKTKDRNNLSVIACIPLMMLTAFGNKVFPVKGNYMNGPSVSIQINRKDSVWTKLIDFCSREGLSIKIIDKSSGLLTFEKLEVNWTYENDSVPEPKNKSAWVVLSKKRQGSLSQNLRW